jgi:hypothetical protein
VDLTNAGRQASRQAIAQFTGLKLTVVDDHVKTLCDDTRLRKVVNGVVELVENFAANRPISRTVLSNGLSKLEVADEVLQLTPGEAREMGRLFYADAIQFAMLRGEREVYDTVAKLERQSRQDRKLIADMARELAGLRQNDLFSFTTTEDNPHGTSQSTRLTSGSNPAGARAPAGAGA